MKPCPFCGSASVMVGVCFSSDAEDEWSGECFDCMAHGPVAKDAAEAVEKWNQRERPETLACIVCGETACDGCPWPEADSGREGGASCT